MILSRVPDRARRYLDETWCFDENHDKEMDTGVMDRMVVHDIHDTPEDAGPGLCGTSAVDNQALNDGFNDCRKMEIPGRTHSEGER